MGRKRRTKWVLIAEALAEDIRVGKYKDAAIFPSVRMLARRFDVAFETARESVRMLEVCGLVIRKGSEGTFLTEPETFLWDGLALIQRGDEQFVNEPHVGNAPQKLCFGGEPRAERRARRARKGPRGNPVASSKGTSYFNDMLGTTVGSKSNGKYSAAALTAFGEDLTVHSPTPTQNSNFFTGKPFVEGLGHAFLMRNYRAGLAKWQTADPMGYPDGWNQLAYCKNDSCNYIDFSGAFARCRYVISTKVLTVFDETTNQAFWTYAKSGNNDPSKQWEQMGPLPVGTWDIIAYGDDLYFQLWYEGDASLDDIATNSVTGQHRDWIRLTINSESHGCICMYPDRDSSWDIMSTLKATEYK